MQQRKVPLRMCLGCQEMRPKKELLRIVKTGDDVLEYDATSKKNGRGAYLCAQQKCLDLAVKNKRFKRIFGVEPSAELKETLQERMERT